MAACDSDLYRHIRSHIEYKCQFFLILQARISARAQRGVGCPFCSGHSVCPCDSLALKYPELLAEWDKDRNAELGIKAEWIGPWSMKEVWWKSSEGDLWLQTPNERAAVIERSRLHLVLAIN